MYAGRFCPLVLRNSSCQACFSCSVPTWRGEYQNGIELPVVALPVSRRRQGVGRQHWAPSVRNLARGAVAARSEALWGAGALLTQRAAQSVWVAPCGGRTHC